jgi:hypothetical protein
MKLKWLISGVVLSLTACNGTLHVYDDQKVEVMGVPFRMSEVYKKIGTHNKHSKFGNECTPTQFVETVSLSTGALYYVNPETKIFAKTSFTLKNGESGAVSEIAFNSEPAAADTLNAANNLLKTILPAAGLIPAAAPPPPGAQPACDTGEDPTTTTFTKFVPN